MTEHAFGGNWTEVKLERLAKYLTAYRTIFTKNVRAQYFKTWYVDAFAGTGSRFTPGDPSSSADLFQDVYEDDDNNRYRDGSAQIALGLQSPFDRYLFIEKSRSRVDELRTTIQTGHPNLFSRCDFKHGDANEVLRTWCKERDWRKERAVVFLDPYGMQVEWTTVQTLALTKAIDLWYLFPLGVGVARLLKRDGKIDESWQNRLDLLFGTKEWRVRFYGIQTTRGLFGEEETIERTATLEKIREFINERLAGCFARVAKGLVLRNSKSSPLYLLCFAAANERGAPTALRIAQDILDE
ncbi:MAG TPA: three-Cys-motif partner protein TcmP [Candidatus Acidoferrales bacterium]|nr:three-Cys-motif partner protein TcmP [Candidatus Acidoferrales bacterium]